MSTGTEISLLKAFLGVFLCFQENDAGIRRPDCLRKSRKFAVSVKPFNSRKKIKNAKR